MTAGAHGSESVRPTPSIDVVSIPLDDLYWDPVLPPRIVSAATVEALTEAIERDGLRQPLGVRRFGARYGLHLGYSRWVVVQRLGWSLVDAVVSSDLTDADVLRIALEETSDPERRSYLERAWLIARMDMVTAQRVVARLKNTSVGTVNAYAAIGRVLTPEGLQEHGIALEDAAKLELIRLTEAASQAEPECFEYLRRAIASEPSSRKPTQESQFEFRELARGAGWRARGRSSNPAEWSRDERERLCVELGPVIDGARALDGLESLGELHQRERQAAEVEKLRREWAREREQLVLRCSELSLALERAWVRDVTRLEALERSARDERRKPSFTWLVRQALQLLQPVWAWAAFRGAVSPPEQLKLRFED